VYGQTALRTRNRSIRCNEAAIARRSPLLLHPPSTIVRSVPHPHRHRVVTNRACTIGRAGMLLDDLEEPLAHALDAAAVSRR
jgi:hypothetical protein